MHFGFDSDYLTLFFFDFWNSVAQLCLLGVVFVVVVLFWIRILGS